ncbi:MAG: hypothetical protein FWB78_00630, partial [Treponema sp.]|nr:hypothetical protein [Treponema sp.]
MIASVAKVKKKSFLPTSNFCPCFITTPLAGNLPSLSYQGYALQHCQHYPIISPESQIIEAETSNSKLQFLGAKRADFVGFATKTSLFYRVLSGVI